MNSRRSWVIFSIAVFAYIIAVFQRSSLGIAGVDITERFGVNAAAVSTLAVVQLAVYAALQIPVGVAIDRIGPRLLILSGAALMVLGQLSLAFASDFGFAIFGRILVGAGDAMTFISVMRLLPAWFGGRTLPIVSQWTGTIGQAGQILSAIPLSFVLHQFGWTPAFLGAASLSIIVVVLVTLIIRNGPGERTVDPVQQSWSAAFRQVKESLGRPGTRLGFWSHFVTQSPGTVFSLLWGVPFVSVGLGYGPATAALLLVLIVLVGAIAGPLLGLLSARFPFRRSNLVLVIVAAMGVAWTAVLAWPGTPPPWLVVLLVVFIAIGGPGSIIGFDFARTFNPLRSLGSANGVVNVGGYLASFVMMLLIGIVLDVLDRMNGGSGVAAELYSLDSFRIAFLVQYPVIGIGVFFVLRSRRSTRRRLHQDEGIEVAPLWVSLMRSWRKRRR